MEYNNHYKDITIKMVENEMMELAPKIRKYNSYLAKVYGLGLPALFIMGSIVQSGIVTGEFNRTDIVLAILMIADIIMLVVGFKKIISPLNAMEKRYKNLYKDNFVLAVLNEQFDNVSYNWEKGYTREEIKQKSIIEDGSYFKSEDYLEAEYNGVKFTRADLEIERKTDDKTIKIFSGRFYEIDFNKKILDDLRIREKNFKYAVMPKYLDKKVIETENVEFNEKFEVRALDTKSAFYVLTPQMMEYILEIRRKFKSIYISIEGTKMYIAIKSSIDSFEISTKDVIDFEKEKKKILGELEEIKLIIDELNLSDRKFVEGYAESDVDRRYSDLEMEIANKDVVQKSMEEMFLGDIG